MASWLDEELSESTFKDKRLDKRFRDIVKTLSGSNGKTIQNASEQWSMARAATYRFLSNDRVEESEILSGHLNKTSQRINSCQDPILVLHEEKMISTNISVSVKRLIHIS